MKIKINDKEVLKAIAELCYDEMETTFANGITINSSFYDLIEEKVAKLIAENKDVIIDRAANMVADSASLKKALDMVTVEINMREETIK